MQLEVSYLQLAIWLVRGVAAILTILRVDSRNNRTRRPIPDGAFLGVRPEGWSPDVAA